MFKKMAHSRPAKPPFPILNLPHLARKEVVLNFKCADLIDFSLCSPRCKRISKSFCHPYTGVKICNEVIPSIKVMSKIGEEMLIFFVQNDRPTKPQQRMINGTLVLGKKRRGDIEIFQNTIPKIRLLYDYIQELFNLPVLKYNMEEEGSTDLLPRRFGITQCEQVWLAHSDMNNDQLGNLLTNVQVSKRFYMNLQFLNPSETARFDVEELEIWRSSWITRPTFLALKCARIELHQAPTLPIQEFITNWFHSDKTRLESLYIRGDSITQLDLSKFDPKPWDSEVRARGYKIKEELIDFSTGKDIIRKRDGLLGTVLETEGRFRFVVWHNRFPA